MRIIFFKWGNYDEDVIVDTLRKQGHFVSAFDAAEISRKDSIVRISPGAGNRGGDAENEMDSLGGLQADEMVLKLVKEASNFHAEVFFSIDYFQYISLAAKKAGIYYYCWIYHLPQWNLYSNQAQFSCNRFFTYDHVHLRSMLHNNIKNVEYLSLAADRKLFTGASNGISGSMLTKYVSEVSFVGNLYENGSNVFNHISAESKGNPVYKKIVKTIRHKMFSYGRNVLETDITPDIVEFLMNEMEPESWNYYFASQDDIVIHSVIAKKITVEERKQVIQEMANRFDFKLYTPSSTKKYPQVKNMGPVDFRKEAPLIFHQTKVNIYITPRTIATGIPLRVLEIMSCQGFVLTNYQEDLAAEFVEGKEIVMFRSLEDLIEKTEYYLAHEEERLAIAKAGYEKVLRDYNYAMKLSVIFTKDSCGGFLI